MTDLARTRRIPVLMYHQVSPEPHPRFVKYTVSAAMFRAQVRLLSILGFETITLDHLLAHWAEQAALPARPIVITFDDGFADCAHYAAPVLRDVGFTAVFYLVAGVMGSGSAWLVHELGIEFPIMDWPTARQLERAGFQCGAHSFSHPRLVELPLAACRDELLESRQRLEDELGHEIVHLAYPHGSYDQCVVALATELGYRTAVTVRPGFVTVGDDLLTLRRIPVEGTDSLLDFAARLRTGMAFQPAVRAKLQMLVDWSTDELEDDADQRWYDKRR